MAKKRKKKPAKSPPPRKAKRTPVQKVSGQPRKTTVETPDEETLSYRRLRRMAGLEYAYDIEEQKSISELQRISPFNTVPLETMQRWSARDGWVEKRRLFFEQVRKKAEAKLGTALVQARFEQLKDLTQVKDVLFKKLVSKAKRDALEAKSLEGTANAYTKMEMVIDEQREKLADAVLPEPAANLDAQSNVLPVVKPRLTQEEAAAAALTIVRMRRDQMRAAMRSDEENDEEDEKKPHMRVIEGEK